MPANLNSAVHRVANELKSQNNNKAFINEFIDKEGFAIWNKAYISVKSAAGNPGVNYSSLTTLPDLDAYSDTTLIIPLVLDDSSHVTAFILAKVADTVSMKLFRQGDYINFPFQTAIADSVTTAENYALRMMQMDKDVFGYTEFSLNDKRLFNNSDDYKDTDKIHRTVSFDSVQSSNAGNGYTVNNVLQTLCVTITTTTITPTATGCTCANPLACDLCSICVNISTTYQMQCTTYFEEESGGGWPIFPPGGGGSGGNPGPNPQPCPMGLSLINSMIPPNCGPTPNPWPYIPPPEFLDQQWMLNKVKDSTDDPCITNAITTLKNISPKFPELIRNFYSEIPNFEMVIKKYTNSNWDVSTSTPTPPPSAYTTPNFNTNVFNIAINKYYSDCTDLGLAVTLIHEAFHCQLMNWYRLAYFSADSSSMRVTLATNYGYLFPPPTIDVSTDSLLTSIIAGQNPMQHQTMITRYQTQVANALYQFALAKNINISIEYCKDLAWSGCFDSQAYKDLPTVDKNRIRDRCTAEKDPYSSLIITDANGTDFIVNINNYNEKGHPCH